MFFILFFAGRRENERRQKSRLVVESNEIDDTPCVNPIFAADFTPPPAAERKQEDGRLERQRASGVRTAHGVWTVEAPRPSVRRDARETM